MAKQRKQTTTATKAVSDANWGNAGTTGANAGLTIESVYATDQALAPREAYHLSVDLQTAISAIARPLSQGKLRFFHRRSGDEITGGNLVQFFVRPCPGYTQCSLIRDLTTWWNLKGEMALSRVRDGKDQSAGMYPLDPFRLRPLEPTTPKTLEHVRTWQYHWDDGVTVNMASDDLVLVKNFNPTSAVRGAPPVLSVVGEISAAYEGVSYNRRFFLNDAVPSHVVVLRNITDPKKITQYKDEYLSFFSTRTGKSHKALVVGSTGPDADVEIKPLGDNKRDVQFANLINLSTERIMRAYMVPPLHGGMWDKTRFDSIAEQNRAFAEMNLMPAAEHVSQFLQVVLDRFGRGFSTERGSGGGKRLTRRMSDQFEKARAERDGDVVVLLDIDHLPIIADLKAQKLDYAQKLQSTFKLTPFQAAQEVGYDIEENEANRMVWVQNTEVAVDPDEPVAPQPVAQEPNEADDTGDDVDADPETVDAAKEIIRQYRKLVLACLDAGRVFKLSEADALNTIKSQRLHEQIRADYIEVKRIIGAGGDAKAAVKQYLNRTYNRAFYKTL